MPPLLPHAKPPILDYTANIHTSGPHACAPSHFPCRLALLAPALGALAGSLYLCVTIFATAPVTSTWLSAMPQALPTSPVGAHVGHVGVHFRHAHAPRTGARPHAMPRSSPAEHPLNVRGVWSWATALGSLQGLQGGPRHMLLLLTSLGGLAGLLWSLRRYRGLAAVDDGAAKAVQEWRVLTLSGQTDPWLSTAPLARRVCYAPGLSCGPRAGGRTWGRLPSHSAARDGADVGGAPGPAIAKPPHDHRQYGYVSLPSGLQVLLVSDHLADCAAAALTINVGSLDDPWDNQGLTHYLEHMLFLGTEKYPVENDFEEFIASNGGTCNACTSLEDTAFHFSVEPSALEGALDRFAQLFACPTFTPSAAGREVNAIDAEHKDSLLEDELRLHQIVRAQSRPGHSFGKFANGTFETLLGPNARADDAAAERHLSSRLREFFKTQYVPPRMGLCVLGPQPLDELEALVRRHYFPQASHRPPDHHPPTPSPAPPPTSSDVPRPAVPRPWEREGPPFDSEALGRLLLYSPVKPLRRVSLHWLPPTTEDRNPFAKPHEVLGHILASDCRGALGPLLQEMGWLEGTAYGVGVGLREYELFQLTLDLTEEGEAHLEDIVAFVFRYLNVVRGASAADLRGVYRQIQTALDLDFKYSEPTEATWTVESLSENLLHYSVPDLVSGDYKLQWDEPVFQDYLRGFEPEQCLVTVASKKAFEGARDLEARREPWYNSAYKAAKLHATTVPAKACGATPLGCPMLEALCGKMQLPRPHQYAPSDFALKAEGPRDYLLQANGAVISEGQDERADLMRSPPLLLDGTPEHRLWYKMDGTYGLPKSFITVQVSRPDAGALPTAEWELQVYSLLELLVDVMAEELHQASKAGLHFEAGVDLTAMSLHFFGMSQRLPQLVDRVLATLRALLARVLDDPRPRIDASLAIRLPKVATLETKYRTVCFRLRRGQEDFVQGQPVDLVGAYARYVLETHVREPTTLHRLLQRDDCMSLGQSARAVQQLLDTGHLEALLHGNLTAPEALAQRERLALLLCPHLSDGIAEWQRARARPDGSIGPTDLGLMRGREVPLGRTVVDLVALNRDEENCALEYHLQTGPCLDAAAAAPYHWMPAVTLDFICHVAAGSAFQYFRTEHQLGYLVYATARRTATSQGLSVVVQSAWASLDHVEALIEEWLATVLHAKLTGMTPAEFQTQVAGLRALKSERHQRLATETDEHWAQIAGRNYDFDAQAHDLACLAALTHEDVVRMWTRRLRYGAAQARLLLTRAWAPQAWPHEKAREAPDDGARVLQRPAVVERHRASWPVYPCVLPDGRVEEVVVVPKQSQEGPSRGPG